MWRFRINILREASAQSSCYGHSHGVAGIAGRTLFRTLANIAYGASYTIYNDVSMGLSHMSISSKQPVSKMGTIQFERIREAKETTSRFGAKGTKQVRKLTYMTSVSEEAD